MCSSLPPTHSEATALYKYLLLVPAEKVKSEASGNNELKKKTAGVCFKVKTKDPEWSNGQKKRKKKKDYIS